MATSAPQHAPADVVGSEDNTKPDDDRNKLSSAPAPPNSAAMQAGTTAKAAKKAKARKGVDPNETGKLLAAKINQLELDAAGEKDQEQEIGMPDFAVTGLSYACFAKYDISGLFDGSLGASFGSFRKLNAILTVVHLEQREKFEKQPAISIISSLAWVPPWKRWRHCRRRIRISSRT